MADARDLFDKLAGFGRRTIHEAPPPPEPMPTKSERLAGALSGWASQAPPEFITWLDEMCEESCDEAHRNITNHAAAAYAAGQELAWRQLRRKFNDWRG